MQRLVTKQDLIDNPELIKKGISVNQHWDFPEPSFTPVFHKQDEIKKEKSVETEKSNNGKTGKQSPPKEKPKK